MNKDMKRKQSWYNLRYYPDICLEELRKIMKTSAKVAGPQDKI
jgi:hypothetical protein